MKRKKIVYEHNASTRDYLITLAYFPNFTKLINPVNKPYEKLLHWLLEKEVFLKDENLSLPTMKELTQELNISSAKISKYLKMIYDDILELNINEPHLFKKEGQIQCGLSFKYRGLYQFFSIGMDTMPRIGEHVDFLFIKIKLGFSGFYVNKVYHDLSDTGHSITFSLIFDTPNKYLSLLKEKAYLHREISFMDFLDGEIDYELQENLIKRNNGL